MTALPGPFRRLSMMLPRTAACAAVLTMVVATVNCTREARRNGWNGRWGPVVPHKSFPADCSICHRTESWEHLRDDFSFDHQKETGYRLDGAHATAACLRCHNDRGPVRAYAQRGCSGCHMDPHKSALGLDCARCHGQEVWKDPTVTGPIRDHERTQFPLVGLHAVTPCESCHTEASVGEFRGAPLLCELCHREDLARAVQPDHVARGWTAGCERCHSPLGWNRVAATDTLSPGTP